MAIGLGIASLAVSTAGLYTSYEGQKSAARSSKKAAEQAAVQAKERAAEEARIQREQTEYYSSLAKERAEWEISTSKERTEFTSKRVQEEFERVRAAQIAGYAASGVSFDVGSPLAVMEGTSTLAESELHQVSRSHDVFAATRTKEAEEVRKGGEAAYEWFSERLNRETGYEVESRLAEASAFRSKEKYSQYGQYLSLGSSLLKGVSMYTPKSTSAPATMSDSTFTSNAPVTGYRPTAKLM